MLVCPKCAAASLEVEASLALAPTGDWDELMLQVIECRQCGFSGIAVYAESRHGALDTERVRHLGRFAVPQEAARLKAMLEQCPKPQDNRCECPTHGKLNQSWDVWGLLLAPGAKGVFAIGFERGDRA